MFWLNLDYGTPMIIKSFVMPLMLAPQLITQFEVVTDFTKFVGASAVPKPETMTFGAAL